MTTILKAEGLAKQYRRRKVVNDISFNVGAGEVVGLLGPNGAGKTTSFSMVAGLLAMDSGRVQLGDTQLAGLPLYKRVRLGLGYLPQEATIFRGLSVYDNFLTVYQSQGHSKWACQSKTEALLERFNLSQVQRNRGSELSGGERRRVEMARTLITNPQVILLDEPFAGVDPIAVADIRTFVQNMAEDGIGVLVTDHNVRETLSICDRAYIISEGRILIHGSPAEIVDNPLARNTYLGQNFSL